MILFTHFLFLSFLIIPFRQSLEFYRMSNKLAHIIKEIVQNQKFEKLQQIYIVDKQTGPYRKIQQAIDQAQPGSLIKISQGLYDEILVINKPLTLEPKLFSSPNNKENTGVILLVSSGHAIQIDIPNQGTCVIRGFKVSHSGNTFIQSFENQLLENEEIMKLFEKKQGHNYSLETEYVNKCKVQSIQNLILHAKRGRLIILSYIVKSCKNLIPSVFIQKDAFVSLSNCQIKGNSNHQTIGILNKLGRLQCKNCKISGHARGGIIVWGVSSSNASRIMNNLIEQSDIGIHLVGEQNATLVLQNTITKCNTGVKLGIGVKSEITGNLISENKNGIEIYSAFPLVLKNRVEKNSEDGIVIKSHKKLRCMATIKENYSVVGNKQNGIRIEGMNNFSRIVENYLIGFNGLSGIRISNEAHPHILLNKIYKNLSDGILIVQNSSAIVEKNELISNIKMNIGLGGQKSNNSVIIQNCISGSRGQGVFMIECSKAMICRNDITQNNDGIVAITSVPIIKQNFISKNRSNGIIMMKNSQAQIQENLISENEAVGVYLRDKSYGQIDSNVINGNEIDVALERNDHRRKEITLSNTVSGEIRTPTEVGCLLF